MDLIITILPVVTKDLPISPRFTPYIFFITMQVQHSYNSSTNGIGVFLVDACGHSSPPPFPCTVQVLFSSRRVGIASPPISLYCTSVILVEERGHSPPRPPPTHFFCWGPGLRLGLCAFSTRGRLSRGIYHFSTFGGGGVF